ncbi:MAG: hypothetical protein E4H36_01575 [Spirochaetales bacterium]|nr:MAG: hypothetical protein E4H36_01575 [Spirochaetales bacterium]
MVQIPKPVTVRVEEFFRSSVSSRLFFLTALVCLPAFLLLDSFPVKLILTAGYILLTILLGRGFRLMPNIAVFISITVLNLFSPFGKVLLSLGPFTLTQGALQNGMAKSVTFIGLIYLSRVSVRRDLRFPGKLGSMLARTLGYFDMITQTWKLTGTAGGRKRGGAAAVIERLDRLFTAVFSRMEEGQIAAAVRTGTNWKGYVWAAGFLACHWGLLILNKLNLL